MSEAPRKRFGITSDVGFSVWDVENAYEIDPETFLSMGRATPFAGDTVYGKCLMTIYGGKTVWQNK
jgi:dihydroorotase